MSILKVNAINDTNGGSNAVLYGVAAPTNSMGFRNRIINGDMRIDQRNAGASVTGGFAVDRWRADTTAQASFAYQRNGGSVTPPTGFTNYLANTSTAAYTPATNTVVCMTQCIEGYNTADFAWGTANAQTVTLSFWVRSSLTGTHSGSVGNNVNRSYVFSFTISATNTWEYKTVVIAGDTTGTWATDNSTGIYLRFNLGVGTGTYGTTTTGWQAGNIVGLSNAVQVSATNGATFYITGVQLEAGSVASPFERRDYGRELMMCQRYFERAAINCGYSISINTSFVPYASRLIKLNTLKRVAPSVTFTATSLDNATTPGSIPYADTSSFVHTSAAAQTAFPYNNIAIDYSASAELF